MVLKFIQNNQYSAVAAHKKLIEVCDGLQLVQDNLNAKLAPQLLALLKHIYSMSVQLIKVAIHTKDMSYLSTVVRSLEVVIAPYNIPDVLSH